MNNYDRYVFNSEPEDEQQTMELDEFNGNTQPLTESLDFRVATDKIQRLVLTESGIELAREQVGQAIKALLAGLIQAEKQRVKVRKAFLELKAKNQETRVGEDPDDYWCQLGDYYGE